MQQLLVPHHSGFVWRRVQRGSAKQRSSPSPTAPWRGVELLALRVEGLSLNADGACARRQI